MLLDKGVRAELIIKPIEGRIADIRQVPGTRKFEGLLHYTDANGEEQHTWFHEDRLNVTEAAPEGTEQLEGDAA